VNEHAHYSGNQISHFAQLSYKACAQDGGFEGSLTLRRSRQAMPGKIHHQTNVLR
jgi:hypothetical protein